MNKKEKVYSDNQYPLNNLDDRKFEELIYSLFSKRISENDNNLNDEYDSIELMPGVAEQGKDCTLYKTNKIKGVIQCKKYKSNLSDKLVIKELLKFSIYRYLEPYKFLNEIDYYLATTTGYTQKAIDIVHEINNGNIESICDFEDIVKSLIKSVKSFNSLRYENIKNDLILVINNTNIKQQIKPIDISIWLNKYTDIGTHFFNMKVILQNEPLNGENNLIKFIEDYYNIANSKFSEVNFIGLDLKKGRNAPTDISIEDIYVNPLFKKLEVRKTEGNGNNGKLLKYSDILLSTDKNLVILGEPGAGKSLLVKDIILRIINNKL